MVAEPQRKSTETTGSSLSKTGRAVVRKLGSTSEIQLAWRGTTILLNQEFWLERTRGFTTKQAADELKRLALQVKLSMFKKYKRPKRNPSPKRVHDPTEPHVSTARLIEARK